MIFIIMAIGSGAIRVK